MVFSPFRSEEFVRLLKCVVHLQYGILMPRSTRGYSKGFTDELEAKLSKIGRFSVVRWSRLKDAFAKRNENSTSITNL